MIVRRGDEHSVLYGRCLHRGALLADGTVAGDNLLCGLHGWDYRIDTGASAYNNAEALTKFTSWLEGDDLMIDIAEVRGLAPGTPAVSPARFPDWESLDYRRFADDVRERSGGIPIGFKLSAQHVEHDLDAALQVGVDYVTLDGRGGGTGAAPLIFRDHISVPTIPALARARAHLDRIGVSSAAVFDSLTPLAADDAVIAVDVGNNTYSFGRYLECTDQDVLMSGYLGSIGVGFPAAMGAWAAAPDRQIIAVTGDGGFGQYLAELTTGVKYGMDITHVLINNDQLGKIAKEQRAVELSVWQTSVHNPDFAEYARICGARGLRVERADQLDTAISDALAHRGPALVEVVADAERV